MRGKASVSLTVFLCVFIPLSGLAAHSGAFLRIGVGARALGMGGAFVALADDPTALYWNPAGLVSLESGELASMYTNQFGLGAHFSFLAFGQPWNEQSGWAIGILNLSLGQIPITGLDENGRPIVTGYMGYSDTALFLAYAQSLFRSSIGVTIKGIHQTLGEENGLGLGIDFGAMTPFIKPFSLGMVLRTAFVNWSTGEKAFLPVQLILGTAYRPFPNVTLALDTGLQTGRRIEFHVGVEYRLFSPVAIRFGLDRGHLTVGAGIAMTNIRIDYALMFHSLGLSHRFSFGIRL